MLDINYPEPDFRIKTEKGREFIFDPLRKKWLLLTSEEWVRMNFIRYLIRVKNYPSSLIAVEKEIRFGELKKRFDILVYDHDHKPRMIVECKAREVKLDDEVLRQALRYSIPVPVQFIIITNGDLTYGWEKKDNVLVDITELPPGK